MEKCCILVKHRPRVECRLQTRGGGGGGVIMQTEAKMQTADYTDLFKYL